jgi:U3 small nucleolar RNA-associated protein 14
MIEPVEIMNRFTEYSPSKGEEPLPLPIPGHWFRKICALAERIARAENERDTLRARITELEADRDSESRWAKEYLARADRAEQDAERLAEVIRHGLRVGALSGRRIGRYALDALDKHHAVEPDPAHDAAKDGAK